MVQFRLLGTLEVEGDAGLVALGGPKERAALALLALRSGRVVSADALVAALWGEDAPRTAVKTLQTYVFRLRRSLAAAGGEAIVTTRGGGYQLNAGLDQVDVARFERELAQARQAAADAAGGRALVHLKHALELWRGDPLGEFSFSDVLASESARLSELRLAAVEQRFALELASGRHHELVGELGRMVAENPLREPLWESLMLALYRSGRQADALRAYQKFRTLLIDELGIEPGSSLKELESRILAQDPGLVAAVADPAPATRREDRDGSDSQPPFPPALGDIRSTFAGRVLERQRLKMAWVAAREGRRGGVLISGEPGIGKTSLAGVFAGEAHAEGATVLYGRCDEEAIVPYQPFVEALRQYVVDAPLPLLRSHLDSTGGEMARLLPELRRRFPELNGFDISRPADSAERYVLFDAVASLLSDAFRRRPLVVVLDDLHWADRSTLLLLRHLLRSQEPGPLFLVGTYRETELGRRHPLAETLVLLRREKSVERIALQGLAPDEVAAIVGRFEGLAGVSAAGRDHLSRRIAAESEGNPLFVWEVVRHLAEASADGGANGEISIPEGVHEVIGRRMARLSDEANRALAVAAVMGRKFELDILSAAAEMDESQVLALVEEAGAAGLVREVGASGEAYEFSHALVRRSLYEELSASRRVRIHRQVASVLEPLEQRRPGSRVAELAHHLSEAAQRDEAGRAVSYCQKAGDRAMAQLAYDEAAGYYRRALEMLELGEVPDDERRAELLLLLGDAVGRLDVPKSLAIILQATEAARRSGSPSLLARAAIAFVGPRVGIHPTPGAEDDLLEEALAALPDDDPLVVRLLAAQAQWLSRIGVFDRLSPLTSRAMGLARRLGDPSLVIGAAVGRLFVLRDAVDAEERLTLANEILRAGDTLPPAVVAVALRNRAHAQFERGAYAAAWEAVDEHRRVVERTQNPAGLMIAAVLEAMRASIEGRFDEAEEFAGRSTELVGRVLTGGLGPMMTVGVLVPVRWLQGRLVDLEDAIRQCCDLLPAAQEPRTGLAAVAAAAGRRDEARSLLAEIVPGAYAAIPWDRSWSAVVFQLAVSQPFLDEPERAAELYAVLKPYEDRDWLCIGRFYQGCFAHHLGVLAGIAGDLDMAVSHLEWACTRYRALGAPPWLARAEHELAQALVRRNAPGDSARAAEKAASAAATATRLKMLGIAGRSSTQ